MKSMRKGRLATLVVLMMMMGCGGRAILETSGPDAGAPGPHASDAGPVRGSSPAFALPDGGEGCGFEVEGAVRASIVGTASAFPAGSEIPFLAIECQGVVAGVAYSLFEQYVDLQVTSVYVRVDTTQYYEDSPQSCRTTTALDGDAAPVDSVGEHVTSNVECTNLPSEDGSKHVSVTGRIAAKVTPRL